MSSGGMGTEPRRPRTAAELDALLEGGASGSATLDDLMSAARAPGHADELSGLDAAVAAMQSPSAPLSRTRRVAARVGAATLATKIVTAAVGAAAVGGAAVAGATGHLPGQRHHSGRTTVPVSSSAPGPSPSGSDTSGPSRSTTRSPSTKGSPSSDSAGAASLPALCREWLALPSGSALADSPRFSILIRTAGSQGRIAAYCLRLTTSGSASLTPSTAVPSTSSTLSPSPPALPSTNRAHPSPSRSRPSVTQSTRPTTTPTTDN